MLLQSSFQLWYKLLILIATTLELLRTIYNLVDPAFYVVLGAV